MPEQYSSKMKIIPNKENLRNGHSQEEPKDTWLNILRYPGWGPGTEKDIREKLRKSKETMDFS